MRTQLGSIHSTRNPWTSVNDRGAIVGAFFHGAVRMPGASCCSTTSAKPPTPATLKCYSLRSRASLPCSPAQWQTSCQHRPKSVSASGRCFCAPPPFQTAMLVEHTEHEPYNTVHEPQPEQLPSPGQHTLADSNAFNVHQHHGHLTRAGSNGSLVDIAAAATAASAGTTASVGTGKGVLADSKYPSSISSGSTGDADPTSSTDSAPPTQGNSSIHQCEALKVWALAVLSATYVLQALTGFSVPIMLPMISPSLEISDMQGAMLSSGYTYLYALALLPMGLLADSSNRPRLLGVGAAAWSALSYAASHATGFTDLMLTRLGLAAAQSTQNVICFSMIPDLFPKNKSTALAVYNCAIYLGRGLMYLLFSGAKELLSRGSSNFSDVQDLFTDAAGNILVPLDKIDLRLVQIMYTSGDMAAIRAISPLYSLTTAVDASSAELNNVVWRQVLEKIAFPGVLLAAALLLTVRETRSAGGSSSKSSSGSGSSSDSNVTNSTASAQLETSVASQLTRSSSSGSSSSGSSINALQQSTNGSQAAAGGLSTILDLFKNKAFMATTGAAALNDVASYALIAWQSTFYERCYHLEVDQYAPVLATLLPITGIIGGVGGGLLADKLTAQGKRAWVTAATSFIAAPLLLGSLIAPTSQLSFVFLGLGFAASEAWRAPSAVMARSVAPPGATSTAMSMYLCIRNIIGALGPLGVAQLAAYSDLQHALEVLPLMYIGSGALFLLAEQLLQEHAASNPAQDQEQQQQQEEQPLQQQQKQEEQQQQQQQDVLATVTASLHTRNTSR